MLEAIQRYRATARAAGVLTSSAYATVTAGPASRIYIQPVESNVVYVPVYDPWLLRNPYVYSPTVPFFSAWLSFSFGSVGFWSRNRIFWGTGIYAYGDPWWWGSWRNSAADWGTGRPTRWAATYRDDQPWTRAGWSSSGSKDTPRRAPHLDEPRRVRRTAPDPDIHADSPGLDCHGSDRARLDAAGRSRGPDHALGPLGDTDADAADGRAEARAADGRADPRPASGHTAARRTRTRDRRRMDAPRRRKPRR